MPRKRDKTKDRTQQSAAQTGTSTGSRRSTKAEDSSPKSASAVDVMLPDSADDEGIGEAIASRDRNPRDERLGRDALDNAVPLPQGADDVPADAVDEIAAATSPNDYVTTEAGDRQPRRDDAEMGFGGEARSIDELADLALGNAIPGSPGTTREGERHGRDLGLR